MNKLQWNFNRNSNIFTEENAFENVICKMTSIFLDVSVFKLIGPVRPHGVTDLGQLSFTSWRPYCDVATLSALLPFLSPVVPRTKADEAVLRRSLWNTRWRHQVETFSALLALCAGNSPVTGEFPLQRPVTQRFDVFFDLCLNKRMSKQSLSWWFETPSRSLWRQGNEPEQTTEQTLESQVNWDNLVFIWRHCNEILACCLGTKLLLEPTLTDYQMTLQNKFWWRLIGNLNIFI